MSVHEKKEYSAIWKNMDETWWHYAKWDKSDKERQILYDLSYMWNLKQLNYQSSE